MAYILVVILRGLIWLLNQLPLSIRLRFVELLVCFSFTVYPKLKRVSRENLQRALPHLSLAEREAILRKSYKSLARMFVDLARLHVLDADWVYSHVECQFLDRFRELNESGKAVLILTGHLGSFELLAHCAAIYGYPMSFVVRNAKMPEFDRWWRETRERNGNTIISRRGAFRDIVKFLSSGRNVGILFDQNVTINHAVFVPWFGELAATTKTVAVAALRAEVPVIVSAIRYLGDEKYKIEFEEFDLSNIYSDSQLSNDDKILRITDMLSQSFQRMILLSPHEWFWMHRRWRTRPEAESNIDVIPRKQ